MCVVEAGRVDRREVPGAFPSGDRGPRLGARPPAASAAARLVTRAAQSGAPFAALASASASVDHQLGLEHERSRRRGPVAASTSGSACAHWAVAGPAGARTDKGTAGEGAAGGGEELALHDGARRAAVGRVGVARVRPDAML